ncbi:MAG: hypothetical protein ACREX3_02180 [Gammaproteobacteria bacterium]
MNVAKIGDDFYALGLPRRHSPKILQTILGRGGQILPRGLPPPPDPAAANDGATANVKIAGAT